MWPRAIQLRNRPGAPRRRTTGALRSLTVAVLMAAVGLSACERRPAQRPPTTAPATQPTASTAPVVALPAPPPAAPPETPPRPVKPQRPEGEAWARPIDVNDPEADAQFDAQTPGGNRLHIRTQNVRVLKLDLHRVPPGVPTTGPWNLMIDDQPFEITGRRGRVITLVRSPGGNWDVAEARD